VTSNNLPIKLMFYYWKYLVMLLGVIQH